MRKFTLAAISILVLSGWLCLAASSRSASLAAGEFPNIIIPGSYSSAAP